MTKKDIAIIGGTFDPIHNGHIEMAKYLSDNFIVDEIWMLPSYNTPHKDIDTKNTYNDRVEMTQIGVSGIKNVKVSTFEKEYCEKYSDDKKTYTIDVLDALSKKYLNLYIHFVVGFDSIKQISTWHNYKDLLKKYFVYVFDRKDDEFKTIEQKKLYIDNIGTKFSRHRVCELFNYEVQDVSSSEIRDLFKNREINKEKLLTLIPENVYNYIVNHNLYL